MKKIIQNIKELFSNEIKNFNLSGQEKAFLLTSIVLIFIMLVAIVTRIQNSEKEILLAFEVPKEEFIDMEKLLEEELENQQINATTTAFNQSDNNLIHSEETFKTLEELMQEQAEQNTENQTNTKESSSEETSEVPQENTTEKLPTPEPIIEKKQPMPSESNLVNKNSFIKYELLGRKTIKDLPNPIYTCDASGMVVINIVVNDLGQVIEADFNASASKTKNNCLINNALQYAKNALFSKSTQKKQIGTITYYFQPKR